MAKSSLAVSFVRVVAALCNIAPQIIKWPERVEMEIIKMKFQNLSHIPGVLGAIDGAYIPIKAPKIDSEVYINRFLWNYSSSYLRSITEIYRLFCRLSKLSKRC